MAAAGDGGVRRNPRPPLPRRPRGAYGRTVGKAAAGIVVESEDGDRPTYAATTARTVLRLVDWLPIGYLLGLAAIAITQRDQRLGDVLAGTVVVRDG